MNLGISLHFKEVKSTPVSSIKDAHACSNEQNNQAVDNSCDYLGKEYINKKRERDDKVVNESTFKPPCELSSNKKNLIAQILKTKSSLLPSKTAVAKCPLIQPSTLSIVNKVIQSRAPQLQLSTSQPKLSQKTLQMIEELNKDRKNRFERAPTKLSHSRSESSFSLRLKNEELVKEERELPIPCKYKQVMNAFIALDNSINYFKQNQQHKITFAILKEAIETTDKHRFSMDLFQQILYVVPHLFVIKWEREKNEYELRIDIPIDYESRLKEIESIEGKGTDLSQFDFNKLQGNFKGIITPLKLSDLDARKKVFKNILLELVNEEHKQFLATKQKEYPPAGFNPFKLKTWHHSFEVDEVKDIPIFAIDPKPLVDINSYERCIKNNDIKNLLIQKALESPVEDNNDEDIEMNNITQNISIDLLKKIKRKENAIKMSQEIFEMSRNTHDSHSSPKKLKEIAMCISNLYVSKDSYSLVDLIISLLKALNVSETQTKKDELKKSILQLTQMFPKWIKIVKHSSYGSIVVIDNKVKVHEEVIDKINIH